MNQEWIIRQLQLIWCKLKNIESGGTGGGTLGLQEVLETGATANLPDTTVQINTQNFRVNDGGNAKVYYGGNLDINGGAQLGMTESAQIDMRSGSSIEMAFGAQLELVQENVNLQCYGKGVTLNSNTLNVYSEGRSITLTDNSIVLMADEVGFGLDNAGFNIFNNNLGDGYILPLIRGTEGQTLVTDGLGQVSWQNGATGDFIPITGTEVGKPVTGDINFFKGDPLKLEFSGYMDEGIYVGLGFYSDFTGGDHDFFGASLYYRNENSSIYSSIIPNDGGVSLNFSKTSLPRRTVTLGENGLVCNIDHSSLEPENNKIYTQRSYVDQANSYSITETKTGGTWIDGKPIYRKIVPISIGSGNNISTNVIISDGNISPIFLKYRHQQATFGFSFNEFKNVANDNSINYQKIDDDITFRTVMVNNPVPGSIEIVSNNTYYASSDMEILVEYTKFNDPTP